MRATRSTEQGESARLPSGIGAAPLSFRVASVVILLGLVIFAIPDSIPFYYKQVGILIFWFASLGTAWTISCGYGGMFSIGNAAFVGTGAYTSTLLFLHFQISPWLGMVVGMALAALLAAGVGYPAFRFGLRGDYFALITIAFSGIVYELVNGASGITGGGQGKPIRVLGDRPWLFQFTDRRIYYYIAMAMWLLTVVVAYRIRHSRFGYKLLAIRDDEPAAARAGINGTTVKLVGFVITAAITAALGTFYAQLILFIDPGSVLALDLSVTLILMAVLGGMASYLGATVGAFILVPLSQWLAANTAVAGADLFANGLILVLLMLYMPHGILGLLRNSPRWRRVVGW